MAEEDRFTLELQAVESGPPEGGVEPVWLHTSDGTIHCRYHPAESGDAAVLWVGGAGGGLDGPAGGLFPRLAAQLAPDDIASLRLDYRRPAELIPCVLDVLVGLAYLGTLGRARVVLVGTRSAAPW